MGKFGQKKSSTLLGSLQSEQSRLYESTHKNEPNKNQDFLDNLEKKSPDRQTKDTASTVPHSSRIELQKFDTKRIDFSEGLLTHRNLIFDRLINEIDLSSVSQMQKDVLQAEVERFITDYTDETRARISYHEQQQIAEDIINDMVGLGPLEVLLNDSTINDIMINAFDIVYVERFGKLFLTDVKFRNERHVMQIAQRIANMIGRRIDESSPMVDARLEDGSRVNIIIPPIALDGISISIRKFSSATITLDQMVKGGSLSRSMAEFLKIAAKSRLNIIVSGGTGAGKTTLLNALSQLINPNERIVTLEDAAELQLPQPHVVRLESRPANIEGEGAIHIADLLKNALRMRPDRIIVGECRGAEAFDMLQAMNTGHDGSMSTIHANDSIEALNRLENMLMMTGHELPPRVLKSYIGSSVHLVVHVDRMRDGKRRITQITEINGTKNDEICYQDIFKFSYTHDDDNGIMQGTHEVQNEPIVTKIMAKNYKLDAELSQALKSESTV